MSGSLASQIRLLTVLTSYDLAEGAAKLVPQVVDQQLKADGLHIELTKLAFACGYAPGREHRHLTTVEFCRRRADQLRRVNCAEANRGSE